MFFADSCRSSTNDLFPIEASVFSPKNQHEVADIQQSAPLSGKRRRASLKRERRKRKRQALAKLRECPGDGQLAVEQEQDDDDDDDDEKADEEQREQERSHQEWLERERIAQEEFRLWKEKEKAAKKKRDDEERRIKEEWEEQQRKERELQEQKQQEKRDREEAVHKLLAQAERQLENGTAWKNPDAPVDYGTEKDKANCPFFIKTGACRFGNWCSRKHEHPSSSTTLMIRGMFVTFAMEQSRRDDYDTDESLEYSEDETRKQFIEFYDDVLLELRKAGKVVQFKVSCNFEPHLRGNVYVQYDTEAECTKAFMMFNGRWYAEKQLQCEFSPVTKWKTAICGLFDRRKCPKGKHCNFLHVFQNPGHEFWEADRDLLWSSERGGGLSGRHRAWSQRGHSPEQSRHRQSNRSSHSYEAYSQSQRWRRSRSRSRERRSRSRSRERWSCSRSRERRSRSRSRERRSRSRSKERRSRSRSRERRSRSRSRERRSRSRSRESERPHHSLRKEKRSLNDRGRRSRSHEKHRSHRETNSQSAGHHLHSDSRARSCRSEANVADPQIKNSPIQKKSERSDGKSPEPDNAFPADANTSSRHHKRSKKSKKKKKNKKKLKRKRSKSCSVSSSAAGSGEDEDEETPTNEKQKAELVGDDAELDKSISQEIKETKSCAPEVTRSATAGIATETGPD